jgi:glycosyltransferase involved in cell wall biosynthesis
MTPLVSFVVTCYNHSAFLGDCINSILNQVGDCTFEVILIDDASHDNSASLAVSFVDPRIRFIHHSVNQGGNASVTEGLLKAKGQYIARIDADDRYRLNFLTLALEKLERFPEVGFVYGDAAIINDRGEIDSERTDRIHNGRDFKGNEFVRLLSENYVCAPTILARREAWLKTLPIPPGLAFADWYFTLMIARDWDFYYLHQVVADYRVHANNLHTHIARNKSEEASIIRLLDLIYSQREVKRELESQKQTAKNWVYGSQYLTSADKYFGFNMNADARRCYLKAIWCRPQLLLRFDVMRRFGATIVGRSLYENIKSSVRLVSN